MMAPLPGLDLTPLLSLTAAPSTSPTLPTTSRDTLPPSPTTARLPTLRLSPLPTLLSTLATPLPPLWPTSDKLRLDQQKKTFIDMLTSILFMIFIHKSIND